jgi:RNA polymerase sigma-70 factor (ECF subfamily)
MPNATVARSWSETMERLRRYIASRIDDPEAAADLVQDVVARSVAAGALERAADLNAWLFRSAHNAVIDHYRTRRPHQVLGDDIAEMSEPEPIDLGPNEPTRELARCLQPMIEQLPAKYRDALVAVDLDGRTHHDAAKELGLSTSGMKSRVQRGRQQLRDLLTQCCSVDVNRTGAIVDYAPKVRSQAATGCACTS